MLCPGCNTEVEADAAICPSCDHILDASFLGELGGESTLPPRTKPRAAPKPAAPKPAAPKPVAAPAKPAPGEPVRGRKLDVGGLEESSFTRESDDFAQEMLRTFKGLPKSEKVGLIASGVAFLTLMLPWRSTAREGDEIGLLVGVWPAIAALGVLVACLQFRISGRYPGPFQRWHTVLGQLVAGVAISGTAIVRMVLDTNLSEVKNALGSEIVVMSSPSFGAVIALLAGLAIAAGGLFSLQAPEE